MIKISSPYTLWNFLIIKIYIKTELYWSVFEKIQFLSIDPSDKSIRKKDLPFFEPCSICKMNKESQLFLESHQEPNDLLD